jgi:hypothetical protein
LRNGVSHALVIRFASCSTPGTRSSTRDEESGHEKEHEKEHEHEHVLMLVLMLVLVLVLVHLVPSSSLVLLLLLPEIAGGGFARYTPRCHPIGFPARRGGR